MNIKKIVEKYPIPNEIPESIEKRLNKSRSVNKNRSYITYNVEKIDDIEVKMVTIYNRNIQYYHCMNRNIVRFYMTSDDFTIVDTDDGMSKKWDQNTYPTNRYYLKECLKDSFKIYADDSVEAFNKLIQPFTSSYGNHEDVLYYLMRYIDTIRSKQSIKRLQQKANREEKKLKKDMSFFKDKIPKRAETLLKKNLPVYLFEYEKEGKKMCYCTKCKSKVMLDKFDKHLAEQKCPSCNSNGRVEKLNQCKNHFYYHQYCLDPKRIDHEITIVRIYRMDFNFYKECFETAAPTLKETNRVIYRATNPIPNYYEYNYFTKRFESATKNSSNFREHSAMSRWYPNQMYCGNGILLDTKYFKSVPGFEYIAEIFDYIKDALKTVYSKDYDWWLPIIYSLAHNVAEIIEKYKKGGLGYLIKTQRDYDSFKGTIKNPNETELHKILGVKKDIFRMIVKHELSANKISDLASFESKNIPFIPDMYEKCEKANISYAIYYCQTKAVNYMLKNNISGNKYTQYIRMLKEMNYPQTKLYLYPKDFEKMYKVVQDDQEERERMRREQEIQQRIIAEAGPRRQKIKKLKKDTTLSDLTTEQNRKMRLICEGLKKMKNIEKFLNGSSGLLVKVPETLFELKREGINLANCIGSYDDSVPEGETIIFFIRQIDEPDDPYYAMEYYKGKVYQIHGYANCSPPKEIKDFCADFEKYLQENNFDPKKFLKAA